MTSQYDYTLTDKKIIKLSRLNLLFALLPIIAFFVLIISDKDDLNNFKSSLLIISLLLVCKLLFVSSRYVKYRNIQIQFSKDNDTFRFGQIDDLQEYNKSNIKQVKVYVPKDKKLLKVRYAMFVIFFNNENQIELSTAVVPIETFLDAFSAHEITFIDTAFPFV